MAKTIEIRPFVDGSVAKSWWQWALIGVIAASGGIGLITAAWFIIKTLVSFFKVGAFTISNGRQADISGSARRKAPKFQEESKSGLINILDKIKFRIAILFEAYRNRPPLAYTWARFDSHLQRTTFGYFRHMISWF
jgi:hypothetical protein